jgi:DNA polymerase-1
VRLRAAFLAALFLIYRDEHEADPRAHTLYDKRDRPLVPVITTLEDAGVGCDRDGAIALTAAVRRGRFQALQELRPHVKCPEDVLRDDVLRELLYTTWSLPVRCRTGRGLPSVGHAALAANRNDNRVLQIIAAREANVLLQQLRPLTTARRLHGELPIAGSVSGRIYMRNPNLVGLAKSLRHLIVPREGYRFIVFDYSQMELRVLAALTHDPRLVGHINSGVDLHRATAADLFNVAVGDVTPDQRKVGKAVNFGIPYGQTSHGLGEALGISLGKAENILVAHRRKYPQVWRWRKERINEAIANGGSLQTPLVGRRRTLPSVCGGDRWRRAEAERKLINHQVQSLAADIAKSRLRQIFEAFGCIAVPVLFAHDEIVLECPEHLAADLLPPCVRVVAA